MFGTSVVSGVAQATLAIPNPPCQVLKLTENDTRISSCVAAITDRVGRWATFQVGLHGHSVAKWHVILLVVGIP